MMDPSSTTSRDQPEAALVQSIAVSLRMWDRLGLSLGEAVVVTGGHRWSRVAALVATWYGAVPVMMYSNDSRPLPPGVTRLEIPDPADRARALASTLNGVPAVVAADLTGRADAVDMLLEGLPQMSRLMLAGNAAEALTIDYYVNVHRKGLHLMSCVFDDSASLGAFVERAERLLARSDRAEACRAALGE
jgi:hypothetical protein